ncbi:protein DETOXIFICATION 48-like [Andrographis paniculata]|uniref:protein DETOXIFICATION 48-like n=1 Tax=Andrographis paniculata TaxID=175694 RepID=UPI0021E77CF8|nr:protein DETOXIFICATION 48-like [Andrographis paniculata]XP_051140901.1 protein DETOXIFICATION 48-like [Andrographis paniculata]
MSSSPSSAPLLNTPKNLSFSEVILEIKMLFSIALPLILTGLLIYSKSFISMLFLGKLGKDALAGGSLAIGIANITGYSVISGLALGMDAISSQAFGAKQWPLITQTLIRTTVTLLLASLPISLLWLNIRPVLLFFDQDPAVSTVAAAYLAFAVPDLFFHSLINPLKIYFRSQNITAPLMLSAAAALAFHAPANYLLSGLGVRGVAVAASFTDMILLAALAAHLCFCRLPPAAAAAVNILRCGFDHEWRSVLNLAVPSCLSVCLEWWWYELMILLSGILADAADAVAAMGILLQATSLVYIFPSALGLAASTRVGNELGANRPGKARATAHIAVSCAVAASLIAAAVMVALRAAWGAAFTDDEAIIALTAAAMPVVGLCELGNCPQTTGCGVLRGSARPGLGVQINLGSFYAVGLPLAVFLGFVMKLGLLGLWLGLLGAQLICAVLMIWALRRTDWILQVKRARELIGIGVQCHGEERNQVSTLP